MDREIGDRYMDIRPPNSCTTVEYAHHKGISVSVAYKRLGWLVADGKMKATKVGNKLYYYFAAGGAEG